MGGHKVTSGTDNMESRLDLHDRQKAKTPTSRRTGRTLHGSGSSWTGSGGGPGGRHGLTVAVLQ